jgi:maltose/moltooligosaccharide transporter
MFYALILTYFASRIKINRKLVHMLSLIAGGTGFISIYFITEPWMLHICFSLVGIAWASILSMPYAMLSSSVEAKKMGVYMGIFNMFIVIPQIIAALGGVNFLYKLIFGEDVINAVLLAGLLLILAGLSNLMITDRSVTHD